VIKLGREQICPNCDGFNISGIKLPDNCEWCGINKPELVKLETSTKLPKGKMSIIIGGQAGSESKGKLSGYLCDKYKPDLIVMTSSPNAGHTIVTPAGEKKVSYHLPIGAIMCDCPIVLGPASLINPITFSKELQTLGIKPSRIVLDSRASVITSWQISSEVKGHLSDIGSTLQGIGECRTNKMKRGGKHHLISDIQDEIEELGISVVSNTSSITNRMLNEGKSVLCETTQGFDLDLEHGIDPVHCTSKMINPSMAMAEAGVSPSFVGEIFGVIRPYPIRVNNRSGSSGGYQESREISWEDVARRCRYPENHLNFGEMTTTTKLPRRVFNFSWVRFDYFMTICRPTILCLQFANYINWDAYCVREWTKLPHDVMDFVFRLSEVVPVKFIGTGPKHGDMIEL